MAGRAQATLRNWLMGTAAAAGLVGPGMLTAQTIRPTMQTVAPPANRAVLLRPTAAAAIRPVAYQPATGQVQLAESEIQQRLRELYERDGREMPPMTTPPAPSARTAAAPAASQPAPAMQPRYSSAPRVSPAAARPSENRFTSFFKKLVPGGNRRAQHQAPPTPPRPLPTQTSPAAVSQPGTTSPAATLTPPATTSSQQQSTPVAVEPQLQPQPAVATPQITPSPAATIEETESFEPPIQRDSAAEPESNEFFDSDDEEQEPRRFPAVPAEPDLDAAMDEELNSAPQFPPETSEMDEPADDFPSPFGDVAEPVEETPPAATAEEEMNPYTGKTLEIEEPLTIPTDSELLTPLKPAGEVQPADDPTAEKMRRIMQRSDMKGLKGFCPVTLRDQRELADSRPEFASSHQGQKFFFASKLAQEKFEKDPARYAPVAFGADVVVLTDNEDVAEGTLDFAAWYKGRLYLFSSQETHDTFVNSPDKYATPPGIE